MEDLEHLAQLIHAKTEVEHPIRRIVAPRQYPSKQPQLPE